MKKIFFIFLILLSLNCLSQEIVLNCKGLESVKSGRHSPSSHTREFQIYFDEQKNTFNLGDLASMCEPFKVLSGAKLSEKHKIDKKKIEYSCEISGFLLDQSKKVKDNISINRVTGQFKTYSTLDIDDALTLHNGTGSCVKTSNKF
jgi:hypothetical protein